MSNITINDILNANHRIISSETIEDLRYLTFIERVKFNGITSAKDLDVISEEENEELAKYTIVLYNGKRIETYIRPMAI